MSALVLAALLRANLAASAAILLILLLRRPVRSRFGVLAAYALWLVPPVWAAASFLPALTPAKALTPIVLLANMARGAAPMIRRAPDIAAFLAVIWLVGAALTFSLFAVRQLQFQKSLGRLVRRPTDRSVVWAERRGFGPAVIGILWPRIVLPGDFEQRFEGEARQLVLTHERVHLARGDAAINALAAALRCLAWFNPLVHLGVRVMQTDQEIACDAAVLARHPHARRTYAEALVTTLNFSRSAPLGCHWPAAGQHPLMERVAMLNSSSVLRRHKVAGAVVAAGIALLGAGAVWAAKPAAPFLITQPDWTRKPTGDEFARFYPAEAMKAGVNGSAVIDCAVATDGRLRNCAIDAQKPARFRFGEAALKMSPLFRMRPMTIDGKPTAGGHVTIPILFVLAK
jgi:TonB family protein